MDGVALSRVGALRSPRSSHQSTKPSTRAGTVGVCERTIRQNSARSQLARAAGFGPHEMEPLVEFFVKVDAQTLATVVLEQARQLRVVEQAGTPCRGRCSRARAG